MRFILQFIFTFCFTASFSQTTNKKLDDILTQSEITWVTYQTDHFIFFVESRQYADQHIENIKKGFETTRSKIVSFLGDSSSVDTAHIIIVDTKEKIKRILGFEAQGFAMSENNIIIFLNSNDYSLAAKHELMHFYSFQIWDKPADNWFSEGLAVYYDNMWSGYQVDSLAKYLKDNERLFKISTMTKKFYSLDAMIAYPQIGSFTGYLFAKYGMVKLKELWIKGFKELKSIYKKSLKELENEWLLYLDEFQSDTIDYSNHLKESTNR